MTRRLLLLDAVLIALAVYGWVQFRKGWEGAREREAATLHRPPKPAAPQRLAPLPVEPPVLATGYAAIAQKMLFDKSRNPDVPVEPPPPPPPKPPMPPLPVYHGVMNIGDGGPITIFSVNEKAAHQAVHPGEMIGPFKLVSVTDDSVTLEWNGETIHKSVEELTNRLALAQAQQAAPVRSEAPPPAPAAPPAVSGPGPDTGRGFRVCSMADGHAEGDVVEGYKKTVYNTPFGQACRYEPVR